MVSTQSGALHSELDHDRSRNCWYRGCRLGLLYSPQNGEGKGVNQEGISRSGDHLLFVNRKRDVTGPLVQAQ